MEKTYKYTIKDLEGTEQEITLNRMTMRLGIKLTGLTETEATNELLDMVAPGVLDIIAPESFGALVDHILEKEKSFFDQLAKSLAAPKPSPKSRKKSK